ncbi:hypothetical protein F5ESL0233_05035 [Lactobacillus sp. ESL0233]|uniref:hypothetical protein n=1 Tax=Lactobacillus sp. ESL0233 TaxID=2069354 RepID=UPI000EFC5C4E|nr:hypothetical protein [Lactobacillus sp. ESL0233]RMC41686.1 hypothetical protein F5ESL0233_05035 [Lactobacillus sp. ESL0233]
MNLSKIYVSNKQVQQLFVGNNPISHAFLGEKLVYVKENNYKEDWSNQVDTNKTWVVEKSIVDSEGSIYVLTTTALADYMLYKLSSNHGLIIDSSKYESEPDICLDKDNNLYITSVNSSGLKIQAFDKNNNIVFSKLYSMSISIEKKWRIKTTVDTNNLYVCLSTFENNTLLMVFNKNGVEINEVNLKINSGEYLNNIETNDGLYLYYSTNVEIHKIEKRNLNNDIVLKTEKEVIDFTVDNIGNAWVMTSDAIYIFYQNKLPTKIIHIGDISKDLLCFVYIVVDKTNEIFVIARTANSYIYLLRFRSGGDISLMIPIDEYSYGRCVLSINSNNDIYFLYLNNDFLNIKKMKAI